MFDGQAVEAMLAELRKAGADSQMIEAKRARAAVPETAWESMSAFANSVGGTLLLGVDEGDGEFTVTGVEDPGRVASDLQSECAELEPPLRPVISVVHLDGVTVIAAEFEPLPRDQRPCHRRHLGAQNSSFIRVGDADEKLRPAEVDAMIAARSTRDYSRQPAPSGAVLDAGLAAGFCTQQRFESTRRADMTDGQILQGFGATEGGQLTLAGALTLGENPQGYCPAARVTARRLPGPTDPPGTRHDGTHLEGTVGELLDDTLNWVRSKLTTVQVQRDAGLVDDTDVPAEALREIISNALVHRSFAPADTTVLVEVTATAVTVTSPGGIHTSNDPALLGLGPRNGLRNTALVRICEQLPTPSGHRIVEGQNLGIAHADRASRIANTLPALFADHPTKFDVILVRHSIDPGPVRALAAAAGVELTPDQERALAVLHRLRELGDDTVLTPWANAPFDARFCARALAGARVEDAAVVLRDLETAGLLARSRGRTTPTWTLTSRVETEPRRDQRKQRNSRIADLLAAIAGSPDGELRPKEIAESLGLASPTSRNRWIRAAVAANLIEPTKESLFDPAMAYRLTGKGAAEQAVVLRCDG